MHAKKQYTMFIQSSLDALHSRAASSFEIDSGEIVAELIGDALRLELHLSPHLRRWLAQLQSPELSGLSRRAQERLETCAIPPVQCVDERLERAAGTRDRVASTMVSIWRSCAARGASPIGVVTTWPSLVDAVDAFDRELGAVATRSAVEEALGERCWLLDAAPWTRCLREMPDEPAQISPQLEEGPLDGQFGPSDAAMTEYVQHGRHAAWVEGFAARSEEFSEELGAVIEAMRGIGEPIGFMARLWASQRNRAATGESAIVDLPLALPLAAAITDLDEMRTIALGRLSPLTSEAILVSSRDKLELVVHPNGEDLEQVELGEATVRSASESGVWRVATRPTNQAVSFSIAAKDGRVFSARFRASYDS